MKYKEMEQICNSNHGKCKNCELNCITDWNIWDKSKPTWCLKSLRKAYENKYIMQLERNQKQQAEETIKEYISIEQKYLKKEGNK